MTGLSDVGKEEAYLVTVNILPGYKNQVKSWFDRIAAHTSFPHFFLPTTNPNDDGWAFTLAPSRYVTNGSLRGRNDPKLPHPGSALIAFSKAVPTGLTIAEAAQLSKVMEIDALSGLMALMWSDGVPHIYQTSLLADQVLEPVLNFITSEWNAKQMMVG